MARSRTKDRPGLEARIPATTVLKLFVHPGKDGAISSYPTTYCVGVERWTTREDPRTPGEAMRFVSQTFFTEWSEDYEDQVKKFESWKQVMGVRD